MKKNVKAKEDFTFNARAFTAKGVSLVCSREPN